MPTSLSCGKRKKAEEKGHLSFSMEGRKQHSLGYLSGPFVNVPPSLAILSKSWPLSQPGLRAQQHSEPRGGVSPQLSKQSPFAVTHINTGLRRGPLLGCERRQNPAEERGRSGARRPQLLGRLLLPTTTQVFPPVPPTGSVVFVSVCASRPHTEDPVPWKALLARLVGGTVFPGCGPPASPGSGGGGARAL